MRMTFQKGWGLDEALRQAAEERVGNDSGDMYAPVPSQVSYQVRGALIPLNITKEWGFRSSTER